MRLMVIGSGTALPQADRSAPCCLIQSKGVNAVVDLGPGSVWGLLRHGGVTARDIDLVLLTHLHPDHCSDLAPLLFTLRSGEMKRDRPLNVLGPAGLMDHHRDLLRLWGRGVEPSGYSLSVREYDGGRIPVGPLSMEGARTVHSMPNLAWRLDDGGACGVVVSGDGEPTPELEDLARSGSHVLVAECSIPDRGTVPGHMNAVQAGELAGRCRSSMLVLTHINPGTEPERIDAEARRSFVGDVVVARDGMVVDLHPEPRVRVPGSRMTPSWGSGLDRTP